MLTVLRREEKYMLYLQEAMQYQRQFSQLMKTDEFSEDGSYMVRSLYFDTIDDKDFFDKITEQNNRRKIRLRVYSPQDKTVKLELKQKENVYQKKTTLIITREDAEALIRGEYGVLLHYPETFSAELFFLMSAEGYRPKAIIEYQRRAFMAQENNIRLTFDSNIRATETCFDLFAETLPMHPVFQTDRTVFEVKYDRFLLGYIAEIISTINRRTISFSKYCLGRSIGYPLYL